MKSQTDRTLLPNGAAPCTVNIEDGVTYESVAKLRPAFDKDGTVTAASASGINDGAAAVVHMMQTQ